MSECNCGFFTGEKGECTCNNRYNKCNKCGYQPVSLVDSVAHSVKGCSNKTLKFIAVIKNKEEDDFKKIKEDSKIIKSVAKLLNKKGYLFVIQEKE